MASKPYARDPRKVQDSARVGEAIRALNKLQKEYEDVLAISEYWTLEEVARYPISAHAARTTAADKMSRAKILCALKLLRNTEPDFSTLEDAIRQSF